MKFSIIVATYNRSKVLQKCVESVLSQKYQKFELLVVDDGSTDDTQKVMGRFKDQRIKYIKLNRNYGAATVARNTGIEHATGDALIIWDSDDLLLPNALEVLLSGFQKFEVGVVCASTVFYRNDGEPQMLPRCQTGLLTKYDWVGGRRPQDAEIIAVKRNLIDDVRFRSRGIDFMFYIEILEKSGSNIAYINETCGEVFLESDSMSLTIQRKKMNVALSIERGPVLDAFLLKHRYLYLVADARDKYAGHAYGAAVGLLLGGNKRRALWNAWQAFLYSWRGRYFLFFAFSVLPFSSKLMRFIADKKALRV
ncbi:MAG: glycosyltransferase family 2 protein [Chlamydiia bacterium]|nr:glycosyltransferase family 2 protein [Chlamydiia bacterium]